MKEKEMPARKMPVDMIEAFVGAISASFRARKIAPFFIRALSGPRCMTLSRSTGYIDISLPWFAFKEEESRATIFISDTHVEFPLSLSYVSVILSLFCNFITLFIRREKITAVLTIIVNNNRTSLLFAVP